MALIPALSTAPMMLTGSTQVPSLMGNGLSVTGMQQALSLKTSVAGAAVAKTFDMPTQLDATTAAQAITTEKVSGSKHSEAQIQKVARDFEAIFLRMLLKEMRSSVQKSGLMGNSRATEFFESMYDEQIADEMSKAGGVGLSQIVYNQLQSSTLAHQRTFS